MQHFLRSLFRGIRGIGAHAGRRSRPGCTVFDAVLLGLLVFLALPARAQLVINEFVASNVGTRLDEDGDSSDWLEFKNVGIVPFDPAGYSVTDDEGDLRRWILPSVSVPPQGYLLIWCSGKNRGALGEADEPQPLTGAVARWPLDEGSGASFANLSDPAFEGYLQGGTVEWLVATPNADGTGPPQEFAVRFSGTNSWIQTDFPGVNGARERTVTFWVKTTSTDTHGIVAWGDSTVNGAKWHVRVNNNASNGVVGAIRTEVQGGQNVATTVITDGEWHHIASVFPAGASGVSEALHYVDGRLDPRSGGGDQAVNTQIGSPVTIGTRVQGGSRNDFAGEIADVRIFDRALDLEGIRAVLEGGEPPPGPPRTSHLHTSFKLDADGESLLLVDPQGQVVDGITFPDQVTDQSYGRSPDGWGQFHYHLAPSPLAANSGPTSSVPLVVADTKFEPNRGFYDEPFEVEITTATLGAVIRYTLDGTAPTATHGFLYEGPIPVDDTTTIRAAAFKDGLRPTDIDAHTYIFLETPGGGGVLNQSALPAGFPATWGSRSADYAMDRRVVWDAGSPYHDSRVREGLLALPSLSIVMDLDDLFDPGTGIYSNSQQHGDQWERPTSVELIHPNGDEGFQVTAGIRMQGNASRSPNRPKHNMRLAFRRRYGPSRLRYPLFEDSPVEEFDTLILRGGNGDSWFHPSGTQQLKAQYIRDQWHRDVQQAMGQLSAHQIYLHLYINGLYWGVYHVFERPNAEFLSSYLGGEEEEYDSINGGEIIDGNLVAWNQLLSIASSGVGTAQAYEEIQQYLDVPNLIDFLLINYHSGNVDWDRKNWYGGRRRLPGAGYIFFCWDSERTFWELQQNQTTLNIAGKPTSIHQRLRANPEYRVLFGDHVHRHFFNDGVLTPERAAALWTSRADEIRASLAAESARWGDNKRSAPYTVDREWTAELNSLLNAWFPNRTRIVLDQLEPQQLYPDLDAPTFNRHGGPIEPGFRLEITAPRGTVYYTLNGVDPRQRGGAIAPESRVAGAATEATLVSELSDVRVLVPTDGALGTDWTARDFDDTSWRQGVNGVGFELNSGYDPYIETDVEAAMHDINGSVYVRIPFTVSDPGAFSSLTLRMRYDDGFVAYLNGQFVADRNAPVDPQWNSTATASHLDAEATDFEAIDLTDRLGVLRPGDNVLAIHGMNLSVGSSDVLIAATLSGNEDGDGSAIVLNGSTRVKARAFLAGEWSALNEATFAHFPLRVTEILYHPLPLEGQQVFGDEDFEFIELRNIGAIALDLAGVRLRGDIEYDFGEGEITKLAPGEFIVVAEDLGAFELRYGLIGRNVTGQYRGNLSNRGGTLRLVGAVDEIVQEFTFDDAWYPGTDGEGSSLVIVDPSLAVDTWNLAASWKESDELHGSPGEEENAVGGRRRPGDANGDGVVEVGDAVRLLLLLFRPGVLTPPCDGALESGANTQLLDASADGQVDPSDAVHLVVYLFRGGPSHILGERCVRVEGCSDACVR